MPVYNNNQLCRELLGPHSGPVNLLFGAYYLDATAQTIFDVRLPNGITALTFGNVDTETYALFGDFSSDISDMFSVSVGGRYTWDQRTSDILRQVYLGGGGSPFFGGTGIPIVLQSDFTGTADFEKFTPRASVSFHPAEDQTIYASYSAGFKGGGFDPRGVSTACRNPQGGACNADQLFEFMSFDPETVDSYELGYRASLFDRRVNLALAIFHADYEDVQIPGSVGTTVGGVPTFIGVTTNAAKARFQGVEFEGDWNVARDFGADGDRLNFSWALGYLNADYLEFIDARGIDVSDNREVQNTPEWTASGTLNYGLPVGPGRPNFITTLSSQQQPAVRAAQRASTRKGFALWDANIVWRFGPRPAVGRLHGRNLTDDATSSRATIPRAEPPTRGRLPAQRAGQSDPGALGREGVLTAYYGNPRRPPVGSGSTFRSRMEQDGGKDGGAASSSSCSSPIFNFVDRQIIGILAVPIKAELASLPTPS